MWLQPLFPWISRAAAFVYYRIEYAGAAVPRTGPLLLVANHPNSLLDPILVAAASRRPVRFLAKAPLFTDRRIGWLIEAAGAIPVYRRADDPTQMQRNEDTFRAAKAALGEGAAIGLFPEGVSHSEPALAQLRTGAARIALGAADATTGGAFPIVPVGLVFRRKDRFRSPALVLTGDPLRWDDLSWRGADNEQAVRALTERIAEELRSVTVNLERWEDRPLVECAVEVWETERAVPPGRMERVAGLEIATRILAEVRRGGDPAATALAREIDTHRRRLGRLRLRPGDLGADVAMTRAVRWATRRLVLVQPLAAATALTGFVLFRLPYWVTGWTVGLLRLPEDQRSTLKLLVGIVVYTLWVVALAVVTAVAVGPWAGAAALAALPIVGMRGRVIRERWSGAWDDARRFILLRTRRPLIEALRARQRELGALLDTMVRRYTTIGGAP